MKTPDEIEKGLYSIDETKEILLIRTGIIHDRDKLYRSALAYIQQLEAANAELLTKVEHLEVENKLFMETIGLLHVTENQLETKCHQLEQERDAAVADIPRACGYCKWFEINRGGNMTECHNPNGCRNISGINTGWEWSGVKEE